MVFELVNFARLMQDVQRIAIKNSTYYRSTDLARSKERERERERERREYCPF